MGDDAVLLVGVDDDLVDRTAVEVADEALALVERLRGGAAVA